MLTMFKNLPADNVAHERKPAGGKSKNNQPGQIDFISKFVEEILRIRLLY